MRDDRATLSPSIAQAGPEPLVILDAVLLPFSSRGKDVEVGEAR